MDFIEQNIRFGIRYPVAFTTGLFAPDNPLFLTLVAGASVRRPADLVFVVDEGVATTHRGLVAAIEQYCATHSADLRLAAPVLIIPGGEQAKNNPAHLDAVHQTIHDAALCRHSYLVAVGGGAVLDVAGYGAATAHRGIRL